MTIEVGRFTDKRLKVIRKFGKNDSNVRVNGNEITIVSTISEVELENDTIEAVNIWNLMLLYPELEKEIHQIMRCYFSKYEYARASVYIPDSNSEA